MTLNFKTAFKSVMAAAVIAATAFTTSCNKDNEVAPLELNQAQATTTYTVVGNWWSPSDAANWPKIYVDLSGSGDASSVSTDPHQIILESHVNGNVSPRSGWDLKYIDKSYSSVVSGDWTSTSPNPVATSALTLGRQTTTLAGWYEYNTVTRANDPVAGRTVLVRNSTSGKIYALKLNGFSNVSQTGSGSSLQVKADINIEFKALN